MWLIIAAITLGITKKVGLQHVSVRQFQKRINNFLVGCCYAGLNI